MSLRGLTTAWVAVALASASPALALEARVIVERVAVDGGTHPLPGVEVALESCTRESIRTALPA